MAGRNEIEYRVDVDASGARRGLTEFSRAAQKAGKDAAKSPRRHRHGRRQGPHRVDSDGDGDGRRAA